MFSSIVVVVFIILLLFLLLLLIFHFDLLKAEKNHNVLKCGDSAGNMCIACKIVWLCLS